MEFKCKICDKHYASYQSLWNHTKRIHNNQDNHTYNHDNHIDNHIDNHSINKPNVKTEDKKYYCDKCNKKFDYFQNRWRHQKKCYKTSNANTSINSSANTVSRSEFEKLKEEIEILTKNKNVNQNVNGILINGSVIINKTGSENIFELNDNEIAQIFNKDIEGVIEMIELINFNTRLPSNHSFCSTALESPYLSKYNIETNQIDKDRKKYVFEDLIC